MQTCDLFVSIPFVVNPAAGIDDNAYARTSPTVKAAYVNALLREMEGFADEASDWNVRSVTLGGGTVSSLSAENLRDLLQGMSQRLPVSRTTPVFATFDPGRISTAHANEVRAFGAPHLTLRYFTADLREGDLLGFPSSEAEMGKTDILLDNLGLEGIGMKVAVGVPGQTEETLLRTLRLANRAVTQRMELTMVRPAAPEQSCAPAADTAADPQQAAQRERLFAAACTWLADHGYQRDAVRAFSRGQQNPLVSNWYGAAAADPADPSSCGRVAFGSGTLSAMGGMLWSNTGDVNRYIQHSSDPQAITEQAVELDEAARVLQAELDRAYRCQGEGAGSPAWGASFETDIQAIIAAHTA